MLQRQQVDTIVAFERTGASLSVVGILLIFVAYAVFKKVRSVPNTFLVFASVANLGASVACLIGYSGVDAGVDSALCQAQGFMFELFMQSYPYWSLAMAVNVFLVFFMNASTSSFLRYWWAYCLACFGIPFIAAITLLFLRQDNKTRVYGNATIWCWISEDWRGLRLYTYYLPIWICILATLLIYFSVGYLVFKQRNQLRNLSMSDPSGRDTTVRRDSGESQLFPNAATMGSVTRDVTLTQVTTYRASQYDVMSANASKAPSSSASWMNGPVDEHGNHFGGADDAASANAYAPTIRITANPPPKKRARNTFVAAWSHWRERMRNMDPVKWAYLRTSFVFAVSVLVTWTPSSINRMYDLAVPGQANYGLNLASAIVLPLQGVWNAIIFIFTSLTVLKEELAAMRVGGGSSASAGEAAANSIRLERVREEKLGRITSRRKEDESSESATEAELTSRVKTRKSESLASV